MIDVIVRVRDLLLVIEVDRAIVIRPRNHKLVNQIDEYLS